MLHTDHAHLYDGNFSLKQNSAKMKQILREITTINSRSVQQKQHEKAPKCTMFYWVIVSVTVWLYNPTCTVFLAANCVRSRGKDKKMRRAPCEKRTEGMTE